MQKKNTLLNSLCQLAKGFEPTELCPLAPPAQGLLIFIGQDVLEHVAQADGPSEFGIAITQGTSLLTLLLATGPFIATQRPERSLQIGSLAGQFLTDLIESLASHLHKMKAIEDDLGLRKKLARSALISRTHIHADKFDLFAFPPFLDTTHVQIAKESPFKIRVCRYVRTCPNGHG
jgi:hypothetical protein